MLGVVPTSEKITKEMTDSGCDKRIWEHFIEEMYSKLIKVVKSCNIQKYFNLEKYYLLSIIPTSTPPHISHLLDKTLII